MRRIRDRSDGKVMPRFRLRPVGAMVILALVLTMIGFQPWNDRLSDTALAFGGMESAVVMSTDHGFGHSPTAIPAGSHCLLHSGCAVSFGETSMPSVSYLSGWPLSRVEEDIGQHPGPDTKPPRFSA